MDTEKSDLSDSVAELQFQLQSVQSAKEKAERQYLENLEALERNHQEQMNAKAVDIDDLLNRQKEKLIADHALEMLNVSQANENTVKLLEESLAKSSGLLSERSVAIEHLQKENSRLISSSQDAEKSWRETLLTLETQRNDLQSENALQSKEIIHLKEKIKEYELAQTKLKDEFRTRDAEISRYNQLIATLESKAKESKNKIETDYLKAIASRDDEIQKLKMQIENCNQQISSSQKERTDMVNAHQSRVQQLQDHWTTKLGELESSLKHASSENLTVIRQDYDEKLRHLNSKLNEREQTTQAVQQELSEQKQACDALMRQMKQLQADHDLKMDAGKVNQAITCVAVS